MLRHPLRRVLALGAFLALVATAPTVAAGQLEDLRKSGTIGERFDGYAVVRASDAGAETKQAVSEINARRKEIYQKRADEERVPVEQVGRVYARKIFDESPAGTWFLTEDDGWVQK